LRQAGKFPQHPIKIAHNDAKASIDKRLGLGALGKMVYLGYLPEPPPLEPGGKRNRPICIEMTPLTQPQDNQGSRFFLNFYRLSAILLVCLVYSKAD
jgi:hypothetical protein